MKLDKRDIPVEVTWNDSDFTNAEWLTIGAYTREYREDGYDGPTALKYAVMKIRRETR